MPDLHRLLTSSFHSGEEGRGEKKFRRMEKKTRLDLKTFLFFLMLKMSK